ncbi:MAG TPA: glycosyl hydrolase [Candidatus Aquilonibacter sp.]
MRTSLVAALLAIALSACGEGGGLPSSPPTPNPPSGAATSAPTTLLLPPNGSIYLGGYIDPEGVVPQRISDLTAFESAIGRHLALSTHYYAFYQAFPGAYEQNDIQNGRIPIDSWDCQPSNASIAAGNQDTAIRARADAIKAFGYPIFLRYMWEMNLPSNPYFRLACYDPATDLPNGQFSPQEYIAAWDRIRAIFAQEKVTNVIWLWNPSGTTDPATYYPGASEVDWIGFDRYDTTNVTFAQTYQLAYLWLAPYGKPIIVGETGADAATQPAFFAAAAATLHGSYPLIKGYLYFDSGSGNAANSWVIPASNIPLFAAMAQRPYMSAMAPVMPSATLSTSGTRLRSNLK